MGYSPWGRKESDMPERAYTHNVFYCQITNGEAGAPGGLSLLQSCPAGGEKGLALYLALNGRTCVHWRHPSVLTLIL